MRKIFMIKLVLMCILFSIVEAIVLLIAGLLPLIAKNKEHIGNIDFYQYIIHTLSHPIESIAVMGHDKNPLFLTGSIAGLALVIYIIFFLKPSGGKYQLADQYGVHGSSRFAHHSEIFKAGEIIGIVEKELLKDLQESIEGESEHGAHKKKRFGFRIKRP